MELCCFFRVAWRGVLRSCCNRGVWTFDVYGVYGLLLVYGLFGVLLNTRWGLKAAVTVWAAAFAALAGLMNHLGRTRQAAVYERVAATLKSAARDSEVDAKSPDA